MEQASFEKRQYEDNFKDCVISSEGPLYSDSGRLMLSINEQQIFTTVNAGIHSGLSYVIHGPYQCGKTSFLIALKQLLKNKRLNYVYLDMTSLQGSIGELGAKEAFIQKLSFHIFKKVYNELELIQNLSSLDHQLYLLVDEFQFI